MLDEGQRVPDVEPESPATFRDQSQDPRICPPGGGAAESAGPRGCPWQLEALVEANLAVRELDTLLAVVNPEQLPQTPGRFVCVVTPGGLEEYFLEIARCSPPPSPAQLVGMAKTYGLILLPPGV